MSERVESTSGPVVEHTLEGLIPDTTYRSLHFFISIRSKTMLFCSIEDCMEIAVETSMNWLTKLKFRK
jgi:hypothetical protein